MLIWDRCLRALAVTERTQSCKSARWRLHPPHVLLQSHVFPANEKRSDRGLCSIGCIKNGLRYADASSDFLLMRQIALVNQTFFARIRPEKMELNWIRILPHEHQIQRFWLEKNFLEKL